MSLYVLGPLCVFWGLQTEDRHQEDLSQHEMSGPGHKPKHKDPCGKWPCVRTARPQALFRAAFLHTAEDPQSLHRSSPRPSIISCAPSHFSVDAVINIPLVAFLEEQFASS